MTIRSWLRLWKEKVREGFFPKKGYDLKLADSRKAINDFKKLGVSTESLADLLLYFVENGVELTNAYGDIDEAFYSSMENTYTRALDLMYKNLILDKFQDRANMIVEDTINIGWGFHDNLADTYYQYYEWIKAKAWGLRICIRNEF